MKLGVAGAAHPSKLCIGGIHAPQSVARQAVHTPHALQRLRLESCGMPDQPPDNGAVPTKQASRACELVNEDTCVRAQVQ